MALSERVRRRLFALLGEAGIKDTDDRHALIHTYTGGRTSSTKNLTDKEGLSIIEDISKMFPTNAPDRMRKKVIALFRSMGVETQGKADMVKIDDWCVQYGHKHRPLNDYRVKELPKLISQVQKVYEDWLKNARK